MKNISILGSTGSIGRQTLEVISCFPEKLKVTGLSCGKNIKLLACQIKEFKPEIVSVKEKEDIKELTKYLKKPYPEIYSGMDGLVKTAEYPENHIVMVAVVGYMGLIPTIKAIEKGKDIALANKETLVTGGAIIKKLLEKNRVKLLPVDSEHSAIFQCLESSTKNDISQIILTASGGPFRNTDREKLKYITPKEALAHPTWNMGAKITVDSATLMNKGLEVIEARWLFDVRPEQIRVIIHPQSIIHSMVEFKDMSMLAQMGLPDMKLPIQYALSYPARWENPGLKSLDLGKIKKLDFHEPDPDRFPSLSLAYRAINQGETMPAVLNAANEVAVSAFLERKLSFTGIPVLISGVMEKHNLLNGDSLEDVMEATGWAFREANNFFKNGL